MKQRIEDYIRRTSQGQLSRDEINHIIGYVSRKPCNMLVFGTGYDTDIWRDVNKGMTVFLEHDERYVSLGKNKGVDVRKVEYTTQSKEWKEILNNTDRLKMDIPKELVKIDWDIIFVDSPVGPVNGRMQSIYAASMIGSGNCSCHIFVHDCDREIEKVYCDKYMKNFKLIKQIRKLRHYKT